MCAVATAWPTERATAIADGVEASRAAMIAFIDAALASPTDAFPRFQSAATRKASRSRSSIFSPYHRRTCLAHSQAQVINR
jgi:hypothetical protein